MRAATFALGRGKDEQMRAGNKEGTEYGQSLLEMEEARQNSSGVNRGAAVEKEGVDLKQQP